MKNLLKLKNLEVTEINDILDLAFDCKTGKYDNSLQNKIVANLFFEPSTRTQYSFNTAQLKLGCKVITFNPSTSSLVKGESLYDTIKTFEAFGVNSLIIRHTQNEYYKQLSSINIPIINAGDGTLDHPTQSLLDLMTIKDNFKKFEGLKVVIIGDIVHSRVAHSNIEIMQRLGMDVVVSGPREFSQDCYNYQNIDDAIIDADVIMLLRVQHERHSEHMGISNTEYNEKYGMNMKRVNSMKTNAIIMHPAPFNRNVEISDDVVECEKSRIFNQVNNGVFIRMAVLIRALGEK